MTTSKSLTPIKRWFKDKGWKPFAFQTESWEAYLSGQSGMIQVPTGSGKTYAAFMGPLAELIANPQKGLQILYVTPLRALARDITGSLWKPIKELELPFRVENRTGDLSSSRKKSQLKSPPEILVITPESLEVILSYPESFEFFKNLKCVIADEWHELMGQKRGTLLELSLSRLKIIQPNFRTWALSATIKNAYYAAQVATQDENPIIIKSNIERDVDIEVLLPQSIDRFPWAGHMGLSMAKTLAEKLDPDVSTLIFTNTRNQAERWYETLLALKPEWDDILALHHSSLDREDREIIEEGLKDGDIRLVVCTSSLDLGVDFQPVEKVVQIGSPKGIARFIQRAGRSAHSPGRKSKVLFVPTHALEIFEINALRKAIFEKDVEERRHLISPFDVLIQHTMTCSLAKPIDVDKFYVEVKTSWAYRDLSRTDFDRCMTFTASGGHSLQAYPQFRRLERNDDGTLSPTNSMATRLHRLNIGTITSESQLAVVLMASKKRIGSIEEYFVSKMKAGDVFQFAGRALEFVRLHQMQALVKPTKMSRPTVPSWAGSQMPFSSHLSKQLRDSFDNPKFILPIEKEKFDILLQVQKTLSSIPKPEELLVEFFKSRDGNHAFLFPFEGRFIHEGLAALLSYQISQRTPITLSFSVNDYGLEILAPKDFELWRYLVPDLLKIDDLDLALRKAINMSELAKRKFREISQIAGLVFQGYPGQQKTVKQVQISTQLLYDVFKKYDSENPLLEQAEREAMWTFLDGNRLQNTVHRLLHVPWNLRETDEPSPLAFPLIVERMSARISSESLLQRIERMKAMWT